MHKTCGSVQYIKQIVNLNTETAEKCPDMQVHDQSLKAVTKCCFEVWVQLTVF